MTRTTWTLIAALAVVALATTGSPPAAEAGTRVGVSVGYGHHGYRHYPRHRSYYLRSGYPYWYWGLSVGYPWPGWGYGRPVVVRSEGVGALDLNVKPKKAEVYVDGEYVGTARQYDGFPAYLWLETGFHELAFYREGYRTEVREVNVPDGGLVDLRLRLAEGVAERPATAARRPAPPPEPRPSETARRVEARPERSAPAAPDARDLRLQPARIHLLIEPGDASVYLDGRLLGSAGELGGLHAGLLVDAGSHSLEVVRPGLRAESLEFDAEAGEEIELVVGLEEPAA